MFPSSLNNKKKKKGAITNAALHIIRINGLISMTKTLSFVQILVSSSESSFWLGLTLELCPKII